jgi:hypothetical protein
MRWRGGSAGSERNRSNAELDSDDFRLGLFLIHGVELLGLAEPLAGDAIDQGDEQRRRPVPGAVGGGPAVYPVGTVASRPFPPINPIVKVPRRGPVCRYPRC